MRRYGESPEKAVQSTIEEYRRAAEFIKPLRDTLDKYAGKVYNKRFLEALRTAAGYDRIYDDRRADMIFIYYYSPDHYDQRTICRIALQDRRIDCNQSKASAADYYAKHLESAAKLNVNLFHYELRELLPRHPVRLVAPQVQQLVHRLFCAAAEAVGIVELVPEGFEPLL